MTAWTGDQLRTIAESVELEVRTHRHDGSPRDWTPIWVVVAADDVFVRTWHRRTTGWYGDAVRVGRIGVRVPALQLDDVVVADVGERQRAAVDAAYVAKYAAGAERMVGDEAAGTTLRLTPA